MSKRFQTALAACQTHMETVLDALLPSATGRQAVVCEAMRYAALGGGKRLRPFLMGETAKLFGREDKAVSACAAALECVHVYSLIHDDLPCMDDDDLRRGKPTVHKAFDEATAVLAGDGLLTLAFDLVADAGLPADMAVALIRDLSKASGVHGMIGGQVIDIFAPEQTRDEALITELQALKTGALIEYAVSAGARLGGAEVAQQAALTAFARDLGLMFQITDDILDEEGDEAVVGKAVGKDKNLGKATFVSVLGLEGAKEKARHLGSTARDHLAQFGSDAEILCESIDFVLNRRA